MKPTELYHDDEVVCRGKPAHVIEIQRIRPENDSYKREGCERYLLSFRYAHGTSSISVWSDEDVPDVTWAPSAAEQIDHPDYDNV